MSEPEENQPNLCELLEEWERTGYKGRLAQIFDSPVKPNGNCNIPLNKEQTP